jgi:hypothetical protein
MLSPGVEYTIIMPNIVISAVIYREYKIRRTMHFSLISRIQWDGNVLWLKIKEDQVKKKYQNDDANIEPSRYLTKNYVGYYGYGVYPTVGWIPARYSVPDYPVPTTSDQQTVYKCDLCNTTFRNDNELHQHVRTDH